MAVEYIYDQIGGFSFFQFLVVFWVYSMKVVMSWSTMLLSFASFKNNYACVVHGAFNQSDLDSMARPEVWEMAKQGFNNETLMDVCEVDGARCEQFYFFGTKRTITSEWSLVCELRWMKAAITSIQFAGVLAGAAIGGQFGDHFGRKKTLYASYLLHTILNVVAAYSVTWHMFAVMRFLIGVMIGSVLVVVAPYATEFFPLKWRHTILAVPMWPLGTALFAGTAWLFEDWSDLHLGCAIFAVPGLLGYFYIPESPRWLAIQGRERDALTTLQKMARLNRKELPCDVGDTIKRIATEEKNTGKGKVYSYPDLFKNADSAKITIMAGFQWFVLAVVYYGLSFAVTGFAGNLYLNIFLMGIVTVPADVLSFFFVNAIGRRWTCIMFLSIAVLVSYACVGLHLTGLKGVTKYLMNYVCLLAKLSVSACWVASQTWVTESYPTVTRSLGYGFANITSRVGGMIAPFVINLEELPLLTFVLMGTMSLVCTIMTYFWPETRGQVMAETVHERKGLTLTLTVQDDLDHERLGSVQDLGSELKPVADPASHVTKYNTDDAKLSVLIQNKDGSQEDCEQETCK